MQRTRSRDAGRTDHPPEHRPEPAPPVHALLELQNTLGNRAVARLVGEARGHGAVLQRLARGHFEELDFFELDVSTWIEFAVALAKLDQDNLESVLGTLQSRTDQADADVIRAIGLVKRQLAQLEESESSEGEEKPAAAEGNSATPSITIGDGVAETTVIRSASDLLVWLVSHPAGQANTPKDFASPEKLTPVLNKLAKRDGMIDPVAVWDALRSYLASLEASDDEYESDDDEELPWPKGTWAKRGMKQLGSQEWEADDDAPAQFKRDMPAQAYQQRLQALRLRLANHQLVGVHATTIENLGSLMAQGISADKIGSNHGKGKGSGFYILPGTNSVVDVTKTEDSAQGWEPFVVAVYLPVGAKLVTDTHGETIETLEGKKEQGAKQFYWFGAQEVVIPASLFDEVILVRDPADITVADPSLPAVQNTGNQLGFTTTL